MINYLIDTHAHLDMGVNNTGKEEVQNTNEQVKELIDEMERFGVKKVVIPSVEAKFLNRISEIALKYENVYSMVGIFPTEAKIYNDEVEEKIIQTAKNNPKTVAVGEIGLDYYWDKEFNDIQKEVFIRQIKLANKLNLPIVVHDREAHKDSFDIIKEYNNGSKVLFHCFSGSVEFMRECIKEGWFIALGGVVTFKNAVKMKDVAREIPLEHLVLETDSPYLTPVPFRGKPNKPAYIRYVAEEIAKIRGCELAEIIDTTSRNAEEFFGI